MTLCAASFVTAFAVAALARADATLGHVLERTNPLLLTRLHEHMLQRHAAWLWRAAVEPFLLRPAWLPPAMLALLCAGALITVGRTIRPAGRT